jgi:pyruvate dehydrogenase (quinone)
MSSPMLAEQLAQALRQAGVAGVYGVVGESHDPIVDAIRRTDGIEWVYVGEEEAEALGARTAASGDGRLGLNDLVRILDVIRLDSTPEL